MNDLQLPEHLSILIDRAILLSDLTLWLFLAVAAGIGVWAVFCHKRRAVYAISVVLFFCGLSSDGPIYRHYLDQMCRADVNWRMINKKSTADEKTEARNLFEKNTSFCMTEWHGTLRICELKPPSSPSHSLSVSLHQPRVTRTMAKQWPGVYFFNTRSDGCTLISK